jgi:hypothetical protein
MSGAVQATFGQHKATQTEAGEIRMSLISALHLAVLIEAGGTRGVAFCPHVACTTPLLLCLHTAASMHVPVPFVARVKPGAGHERLHYRPTIALPERVGAVLPRHRVLQRGLEPNDRGAARTLYQRGNDARSPHC